MNKKIVILIFFTLAVINTSIAGFLISDIGRETELLSQRYESAQKLESSLYDSTSLKQTISKLEDEISARKALVQKIGEPLKMTEGVLRLFEINKIKVIAYRLEGEENREELVVTGEGKTGSILKLIYEISFSKEKFRINFISVDAGFPGKPAAIVIRITYA